MSSNIYRKDYVLISSRRQFIVYLEVNVFSYYLLLKAFIEKGPLSPR